MVRSADADKWILAGMDEQRQSDSLPAIPIGAALEAALKQSLCEADETTRFNLVVDVFHEYVRKEYTKKSSLEAAPGSSSDQAGDISRKVRSLDEANAVLRDQLSALQADLGSCTSQLEAQNERVAELDRQHTKDSQQIKELLAKSRDTDSDLETRNRDIHQAQLENDQLLLKLQRAELAQEDTSKFDRASKGRHELAAEVESLRSELKALRTSKDAQIVKLNQAISEGGVPREAVGAIDFTELWQALIQADPPLVIALDSPTMQAGQRVMALLIELLHFVDDVDQLVRPFIGKYTRDHQAIQVPWDVYARGDSMRSIVQTVLHPVNGKTAGVAKVRLRGLYAWLESALIAADVTIESVATELHAYAMQQGGVADDPNRRIKDFLREDGHELFQQHLRLLCSRKLAEAFGHSH